MKFLVVIFMLYPFTSSFAQWAWAVKSNGTGYEAAFDVESDANGNNYVIGNYSTGNAVFGNVSLPPTTSPACFLAKTDINGSFVWAVNMGGSGSLQPSGDAVATIGTDVFVTGVFRGALTFYSTTAATVSISGSNSDDECYIARYNANGVIQWAIKYGGAGHQKPMDIAISDAAQRVFVTGSTANKIFTNCYGFSGATQWSVLSTNTSIASGMGITADAAGNSYIVSKFASGPISLPGTAVFNGTNNMLLAKYNLQGTVVWMNNIGGAGSEVPIGGIDIDGSNNLYISGEFSQTANISGINLTNNSASTTDIFIAKYNNSGTVQWAKKSGGVNAEYARGIVTDNAGNSFIAVCSQENNSVSIDCQTFPSVLGNTDNKFYVIKYDNAGNVAWVEAPAVSLDNSTPWGIATNGDGNAVVAGQLRGVGTFGNITLTSTPSLSDALVFKVKKSPISSDFTLNASFPSGGGGTYQISAVPAALTASFWWEVMEIDIATGAVIPGTTMTNPANWWVAPFIANNTFPGYCCNPTISSGYGTFTIGHKYRITRGTWGNCSPWNSTSKTVYMSAGLRSMDKSSLIVKDDPSYLPPPQK